MSKAMIRTRQAAMKRYFKYSDGSSLYYHCCGFNENIDGVPEVFNTLTDPYSIVITEESCKVLEDVPRKIEGDDYENIYDWMPNVFATYFDYKKAKRINLCALIDDAKNNGYRFKKAELGTSNKFTYVWKYQDTYGKIGILDQAFSIINNNEAAHIIFNGWNRPVFIKTTIGVAAILPMRFTNEEDKIIIDMENYIIE